MRSHPSRFPWFLPALVVLFSFCQAGQAFPPAPYYTIYGTVRDEAGQVLARVDVRPPPPAGQPDDSRHMRGPRGLALHPTAPRLYVLNRISQTISVIDTTTASVVAETRTASHQAMPEEAHAGRGFIFWMC